MSDTILERTSNGLNKNSHNIGEAPNAIDSDAFLPENDPVMCLGCVSYMRMRNLNATHITETMRPGDWFVFLDEWLPVQ